jgi:hypothetical protein
VTALKFQGSLTLGVGTATGQVLLYDIRSSRPFLVKDHMYGLRIHDVDFHDAQDLVLSMDSSVIKIWGKQTVCKFLELFECNLSTEFLIFPVCNWINDAYCSRVGTGSWASKVTVCGTDKRDLIPGSSRGFLFCHHIQIGNKP